MRPPAKLAGRAVGRTDPFALRREGYDLTMGIEDQFDQTRGRVEQSAGDLTDNEELKAKGEGHETEGKVKEGIDAAKDKLTGIVDSIADKKNR